MTRQATGRMQLTILGGFLGSGKTTWLRHQLHGARMPEALVVVNEAAAVPVDDAILAGFSRIAVLSGGCACCDGRADFVTFLRDLANLRTRSPAHAASRLVLETSGLADPAALAEAVRSDPILVHHVGVDEIVVAVDATNGLDQFREEPLMRAQIEAADHLVVTKTDRAEKEALRRLVSALAIANPGARISGAAMGTETNLPAPDPSFTPEDLAGDVGHRAEARPIVASTLDLGEEPDWTSFTVWLSALLHARGDEIVRVKGVVRTPAGRLLLQSVRHVVQAPEILPEVREGTTGDNRIAIIGRGFSAEELPRSLQRFTGRGMETT